jgi:small acid-soluble spore protein E (minor gamma-type SASP)
MAKRNQAQSQTNAQQVRQQNQAAAQGQNAEFANETDAQEVRRQNQQSQAKKGQQQQ